MSLLSINRLTLHLSPFGVAGLARSRLGLSGVRGSFCQKHEKPLSEAVPFDLPVFQAALKQLGAGPVEIMLAGHYVRYQIFPWQASLETLDEELGFARFAFTQTYGSAAESWRVALSDEAPGVAKVAAAIDGDLLDCLADVVKAEGGELVAVRPSLMPVVNYWRQMVDDSCPTWFLVHEDGVLSMALLDKGAWRWVRTRRVGEGWLGQWHEIIADEAILFGEEVGAARVLVFAPDLPPARESRVDGAVMSMLALPEAPALVGLNNARLNFARVA